MSTLVSEHDIATVRELFNVGDYIIVKSYIYILLV